MNHRYLKQCKQKALERFTERSKAASDELKYNRFDNAQTHYELIKQLEEK